MNTIAKVGWLLLLVSTCIAHTCIQDSLFDLENTLGSSIQYSGTYPTKANAKPIRLRIDTTYLDNDDLDKTCITVGQTVQAQSSSSSPSTQSYTCTSSDLVTANLNQYLKSLVAVVQQHWQQSLLVMPVIGNLVLQSSTSPQGSSLYGGVNVASVYTTTGVPVDVVIYVTARPILQNGGATSTLAVARVVQEDQFGRPILGLLNVNPAGIKIDPLYYAMNLGVLTHETTHSLGFNIQKFQNVNPTPSQNSTDITRNITIKVGANDAPTSRIMIVSPRVVAWAKAYYGCNEIQGVELENQGGSGTSLSHWEKRITMNEYMTGTASRNPVYSALTLAVMEDSGWYLANYDAAGSLLWGQGMGCDFINRGCDNWPNMNGYFCTDVSWKGCSSDYQAKSACQIGTSSTPVPAIYQYFSDPTQVGSYELPDYCPLVWGYANGWCFDPASASSGITDRDESFSASSRCFMSTLAKGLVVGGTSDTACYKTLCTGPNELRVNLGNYWYICPAGTDIKVIGFGGTLTCPTSITQVCGGTIGNGTFGGGTNGTLGGGTYGFPSFISITPNSGGPGLVVTITGKNFVNGTLVTIKDPLINIVVISDTLLMATIPDSSGYQSPTNIINQDESVIITNPSGYSAVGYNKFTIQVKINAAFFRNVLDYMKNNWLVTAAVSAAIAVTIAVCGYCCCRQKGKAEEADTQYYE